MNREFEKAWGWSRESLASQGKEATIDQIVSSVRAVLEKAGSMDIPHPSISGVGVGCPGPLNTKEGIVYFAPNLSGWKNVPLVRILRDKIQLPIFLENDANAAALGEWWMGAGRDVDDLVLLTLGTGIGGGIIIRGEVLHGAWDTAAEVGHMIILLGKKRGNMHAITIEDENFCCLDCLIKRLKKTRKW